jgi:hypothetical protein
LDAKEKAAFGLDDSALALAYRYESPPYAATLDIRRIPPRSTARTYSFLRLDPEGLFATYEIIYDVRDAAVGQLALRLPEATPESLEIRGLDGLVVKETTKELVDGQRRWLALLAERKQGTLRLSVRFQQPLDDEPKDYPLPLIVADDVQYQSAIVAVEGSAEYDLQIDTRGRKVDVGELVDADYQVGRRLLGVFGFVGESAEVRVDVFRRPNYALPAAIVERAEFVTLIRDVGVHVRCQSNGGPFHCSQ